MSICRSIAPRLGRKNRTSGLKELVFVNWGSSLKTLPLQNPWGKLGLLHDTSPEATWKNHSSKILKLDQWASIDLKMAEVFAGKPAEERLEKEVIQMLPGADQGMSMQQVLDELKRLQGTELFKYAGKTGKAVVTTSIDLINKLASGVIPSSPEGRSDFYLALWAAMPYFVSTQVPAKSPEDAKDNESGDDVYSESLFTTIRGKEALVCLWEEVKAKKDAAKPEEFETLCLFSKWLPHELQADVNNSYVACLKKSTASVSQAASSSSSSSKPVPQKRKAAQPSHKNKAARSFLGF